MALFRSFRRHALHVEIWVCLAWARFLTRYIRLGRWQHHLGDLAPEDHNVQRLSERQSVQAANVGKIVRYVARNIRLFEAVCLPQAMAARWVLARRGIASHIMIGSRRDDDHRAVRLHAWLMAGDIVVTGERERAAHVRMRRAVTGSGRFPK